MALIPNFPAHLHHQHTKWHQPGAAPADGGRDNAIGRGLEFLRFHRRFIADVLAWYPGPPQDLAPWITIPDEAKQYIGVETRTWDENGSPPETVTNEDWPDHPILQDAVARIENFPLTFATANDLGEYIEGPTDGNRLSLHEWLHYHTGTRTGQPNLLRVDTSVELTEFYAIHGMIDGWWRRWEVDDRIAREAAANLQAVTALARPPLAGLNTASDAYVLFFGLNDGHTYEVRMSADQPGLERRNLTVAIANYEPTKVQGLRAYLPQRLQRPPRVLLNQNDVVCELERTANEQWTLRSLGGEANAPFIVGAPNGITTAFDSASRVFYVGGNWLLHPDSGWGTYTDYYIHELSLLPGGIWQHINLSIAANDFGDAEGSPFAYTSPLNKARVVFKRLAGQVEQLTQQPDNAWVAEDLTGATGAPVLAESNPVAHITAEQEVHVFYRGTDKHIHELYRPGAAAAWIYRPVTELMGAPLAASDLAASLMYWPKSRNSVLRAFLALWNGAVSMVGKTDLQVIAQEEIESLVYRGTDDRLNELRRTAGGNWVYTDLTGESGAPASTSDPVTVLSPWNDGVHVVFLVRDEAGAVGDISLRHGGSWQYERIQPI